VVEVKCPDDRFQFVVRPKAAKTQVVGVVFAPDARRGPFEGQITIQTDIANHETLDLAVNGRVGSAETDTPKEVPPKSASADQPTKQDNPPPPPVAP
jgi:hypothetical protein